MIITAVETICLQFRMPYALTYARGEYSEREALLIKVHTDEPGLIGWGEAAMWGGPWATSVTVVEKEIAPLIIGLDPRQPEYIWERVYQQTYYHGRKGILLACLSGIDIALWDILGQAAGHAVWRLLGGYGRPLRAYGSSGYYRRDYGKAELMADVGRARAGGFLGYKMKVGNIAAAVHARTLHETPMRVSFAEDIERVKAARQALGPDLDLMCDATTSLDHKTAMAYADAFEEIGVRWFEEPTQPENIAGCSELARRTRIPIAGFETETSKFNFAALMDAGAIQIAQPDVIQVGGLTEARKIAAYAQMRHLLFSCKNYSTAISLAACLNLLYAMPNADFFECDMDPSPWRADILNRPLFAFESGLVAPFDRPGLGLDINEEELKRWQVAP
jgi:D-arabinonate dehydratase/D-galactarolactone cycloisomerase